MVQTTSRNEKAKSFYDSAYAKGHATNYGGTEESFKDRNAELLVPLNKWLLRCKVAPDSNILEVGCGMGYLWKCHPNWHGIEYSSTAVKRAKEMYGDIPIQEGDARDLPVNTESVDFLFTFAVLEHVPYVEKAFSEIDRVVRSGGGVALVSPAWNCRPWTVRKLQIRPYSDLKIMEKLEKLLIPIRGNLVYRAICSIPSRLAREIKLVLKKEVSLEYKDLHPDLSLNDRYPHISDDDAFVSIDAHAALVWFKSRGYTCISHPRFLDRITVRGEEIVVRKP